MSAHNILENTIIGFVSPEGLKYVTTNYDVADLTTGKIVSNGGRAVGMAQDDYATEVADHTHAVYGRDIAAGISMTVAKRNAKPSQHIGITVTTMRTNGSNGWSIVETLAQQDAVRLMHKWYIEHGLMDLYMRNKYTAISGFQEWVCGKLIEFFTPNNKLQWYGHVMDIDYEMEAKGCEFTECLCDTKVPSENRRHVIPHQLYDRFGLFGHTTRMAMWAEGKPETDKEANMILHEARIIKYNMGMDKLMGPLLEKVRLAREAQRNAREDADALQEKKDRYEFDKQRKADMKILTSALIEKKRRAEANGGGCGLNFDGPVKYIDPFRGMGHDERLKSMET